MTTAKLSVLQRAILVDALAVHKVYEANILSGRFPSWLRHRFPHEGVPWKDLSIYAGSKTASERAAYSRALRRLEQRGLIVRVNVTSGVRGGPEDGMTRCRPDQPHRKADHLRLTADGWRVAETVNLNRG